MCIGTPRCPRSRFWNWRARCRSMPTPRAGAMLCALHLHLEEYLTPMAAHSAYAIVPFGVLLGSPTAETYRALAGELTYRYFMPVRKQSWWLSMTPHLECYALLLAEAAQMFGRTAYRDLAYLQLEWVMGANPFGACLMSGEGMRNPYPHSRFVGLIPGGIMNGIAGNAMHAPVLDMQSGFDWRTTEYWSPHQCLLFVGGVDAGAGGVGGAQNSDLALTSDWLYIQCCRSGGSRSGCTCRPGVIGIAYGENRVYRPDLATGVCLLTKGEKGLYVEH